MLRITVLLTGSLCACPGGSCPARHPGEGAAAESNDAASVGSIADGLWLLSVLSYLYIWIYAIYGTKEHHGLYSPS